LLFPYSIIIWVTLSVFESKYSPTWRNSRKTVKKINLETAEEVWQSYPQIISVWLFGSAQDGELSKGSDLDFALLFEAQPPLDELASIRADLQENLQVDDIDLTYLNKAGPVLAFQAVSGRLVFCRDLDKKVDFVSLTAREYEEAMAFMEWGIKTRRQI